MSDTKNTNTIKKSLAGEEIAEDKLSSQEMPEQEASKTPQSAPDMEKEKGFLGEVAEDIGEGAKKAGEKATDLADIVVDQLKKGWSQAYEAGAKLSQAAHEYVEKYKAESEIEKLKDEKNELMTQLGQSIFKHHLSGGKFTESFFNKKEVIDQFNQVEILDKKIIRTGKKLDKGKE